ncbi:hypothetical protein D3C79_449490 [compost metagenome]
MLAYIRFYVTDISPKVIDQVSALGREHYFFLIDVEVSGHRGEHTTLTYASGVPQDEGLPVLFTPDGHGDGIFLLRREEFVNLFDGVVEFFRQLLFDRDLPDGLLAILDNYLPVQRVGLIAHVGHLLRVLQIDRDQRSGFTHLSHWDVT